MERWRSSRYITAARPQVQLFSEKEITLLENFAAQAVIAMENARLITETREALEQQTATAEVLGVINSSPADLRPVFEAMLEKATRLCEGSQGVLWTIEDGGVRSAATFGVTPEYAEFLRRGATPGPTTPFGRIMRGERIVEILDLAEDEGYRAGDPVPRAAVEIGGLRSMIFVALLRDETLLGAFAIARQEVRPFTDRQIALLQSFAQQAVIAMENARLITETREALDQQTATAEVLQVINASPGNPTPVFDAILEKAHVLCGAPLGSLVVREGEHLRSVATRGYPQEYDQLARRGFSLGTSTTIDRLLNPAERWVQVDDVAADIPDNELSVRRAAREIAGFRTALWVPLRKDGYLLGYISAQRKEVRPFTGKQIGLLENFAAQAVIAMENARLITETQEALDQQTATAEVLGVINSSPGDLAPVFDAMLEKAMRLCNASFGELRIYETGGFRLAAIRGVPAPYAEFMGERVTVYGPGTGPARLLEGERVVQIPDLADSDEYRSGEPNRRAIVDLAGARTLINVSLRKDDALLGFIMFYRQEVRPFSDKQITLLQNFAAQAVIAMENARLLGELHGRTDDLEESLEYQTATSDVLKVISRSAFDLDAVLKTVVDAAARLCDADLTLS